MHKNSFCPCDMSRSAATTHVLSPPFAFLACWSFDVFCFLLAGASTDPSPDARLPASDPPASSSPSPGLLAPSPSLHMFQVFTTPACAIVPVGMHGQGSGRTLSLRPLHPRQNCRCCCLRALLPISTSAPPRWTCATKASARQSTILLSSCSKCQHSATTRITT